MEFDMLERSNSHVVIVLGNTVRIFAAPKSPPRTLRANNIDFREVTSDVLENVNGLTGHHDWLISIW